MKNLMLLITFGFILFSSCSTEDINEPTLEQKTETTYIMKLSNNSSGWEIVNLKGLENKSSNAYAKSNSNSLHAHGDFNGFDGTVSFSGTQNNGGAHGSSEIEISFGPFGAAHVIMETVSVVSSGDNEVIYGGQIIEVIENTVMFPPPPGAPPAPCDSYDVGTYVYFVVKDNGQGNNAPADQYRGVILNSCNEQTNGGGDIPWFYFGLVDVTNPSDQIKVND